MVFVCNICKKEFISERFLDMHSKRCKWRKDSVRNLELELNIDVDELSVHGCRFCNASRINRKEHYPFCSFRNIYKETLKNQLNKNIDEGNE